MAVPFVEGRLRKEVKWVDIKSACACCGRSLRIRMSADLETYRFTGGASPLVFEPHVDWNKLKEPTIVNVYCRNSLFFWSEEHATRHRGRTRFVDGIYLTLEQSIYATRIAQGALFAF